MVATMLVGRQAEELELMAAKCSSARATVGGIPCVLMILPLITVF